MKKVHLRQTFQPSINVSNCYKIWQNVTQKAGRVSTTAITRLQSQRVLVTHKESKSNKHPKFAVIIEFCKKKTFLFIIYILTVCSFFYKWLFKMSILIKIMYKLAPYYYNCIYYLYIIFNDVQCKKAIHWSKDEIIHANKSNIEHN